MANAILVTIVFNEHGNTSLQASFAPIMADPSGSGKLRRFALTPAAIPATLRHPIPGAARPSVAGGNLRSAVGNQTNRGNGAGFASSSTVGSYIYQETQGMNGSRWMVLAGLMIGLAGCGHSGSSAPGTSRRRR